MEMGSYELAKKVIEQLPESGKKYVCLNGYQYAFENEYLRKYELCTDNFDVILAYFKIYDPKIDFSQVLLTKLGYSGGFAIETKPPFSLTNNAVFIWLGKELFFHDEAQVVKTKTGYNDNGEPVVKVDVKHDMNPMSIEAIGWCLKLAFMYNRTIQCGIYGVLFQ